MEPNGHPGNHTEQNKRKNYKNKILRPLQEPRKSKKINKLQKTKKYIWNAKTKNFLRPLDEPNISNKINKIQKTEIFYGLRIPKTI